MVGKNKREIAHEDGQKHGSNGQFWTGWAHDIEDQDAYSAGYNNGQKNQPESDD